MTCKKTLLFIALTLIFTNNLNVIMGHNDANLLNFIIMYIPLVLESNKSTEINTTLCLKVIEARKSELCAFVQIS